MAACITNLTSTLERLLNLGIFLVQTLASLLGKRVLVSVRRVVSRQHINGSVKSAKGWLSSNLGETTVVRHKVDHFLLHVLSEIFHSVGSLAQTSGKEHVVSDLGSVLLVFELEAPVGWEFVRGNLRGDFHDGRRHGGDAEDDRGGSGSCGLEKVAASGSRSRFLL
jgi:hypothetical protein